MSLIKRLLGKDETNLELSLHDDLLNGGKREERRFYIHQYYSEKHKKAKEVYDSPFIANYLERKFGQEKFEKIKKNKLYAGGVGALVLNTFSYAIAFPYEKLLAGMTWKRHLSTRGIAFFTNTVTEKPIYERVRTATFKKFDINDNTPVKKYIAETGLFFGLQMPLHWGNMIIATLLEKGTIELEDVHKMALASLPMIPIAGLTGWPYGKYLDRVRFWFGLPKEYAKDKQQKHNQNI